MPARTCLFIIFALTLDSSQVTGQDAAEPTKLKGLLITGGCCHDYENQKRIITQGVSQRASISWDIVHEGGSSRDHRISVYSQKAGKSHVKSL